MRQGVLPYEVEVVEERAEETVCCAQVEFTPGDWPKGAKPLRYVALRIGKTQGRLFASGYDTKYLAVVSNRWDLTGPQLLRWHWGKAGTIEHVHDVTKNELGAGGVPCGRFGANAAWYRLSLLAYKCAERDEVDCASGHIQRGAAQAAAFCGVHDCRAAGFPRG